MINRVNIKLYFFLLSIFIIFIDQLSKYYVLYNHKTNLNKNFILFRLDLVKNYGAAFNILSGSRIFLSIISVIFSIILIYLILRKGSLKSIDYYAYSFILGGTFGNGIDRIINGFVVDFINLNFITFPLFNIADISINIGFFLLIYSIFKFKR